MNLSDFRKPQQPLTMSTSSKIHLMDLKDDTLRSALKHEDFFSDIYVARMEGIRITSSEMSKKNEETLSNSLSLVSVVESFRKC